MVANLVNIFSQVFNPLQVQAKAMPQLSPVTSNNPFSGGNPFMGTSRSSNAFYGKNAPVKGGYFAGYYNGQPNIVGKRLFLEV